ncbi:aminotransferase class III-fold pyridoxal phosphate-dependent enzyme [Schumannella sp. 10F1B-5-1]|uniref:aminotransferase class III-fold pyridoxal phosphate-dependent enzyme n=1 Tax=Schumannella sp. 10F1B-5-1 TaxID=2590780 RepID=UPI001131F2E7|nr:aminotransferase class III-fold pyridoxal phosphate-dependent enzyme [Schumannella sp. 10F1B-5-1]TPW78265.1 aminotransferase class III-fold pyridoxal phosphate-dependent enzyme [Schumannella sp. 10F1B-5-1]
MRLIQHGADPFAAPPFEIVGGEGAYLRTSDGRQLLDASNTGGPLGHAHPAMVEAIVTAARFPVANESQPWRERELAAEELIDIAFAGEGDWIGGLRFGLSGSEVNDTALTLAQSVTGRLPVVARERAYHGLVGLARDVTLQPQWHGGLSHTDGSGVSAPAPGVEVRTIAAPDGAIWMREAAPAASLDPTQLAAALDGSAAVIVDYTQGGRYHDAAYQDAVATAAADAGALWIADEVVTGLGRGGSWFAFQKGERRPDIVTLGKPIAGGAAPGGAVVLSKELVERLDGVKWQSYSTFRGHPVMVHAVRAHLRVVRDEGLVARAAAGGELLAARLREIAERHPSVQRVAGDGLHWTIELVGMDWREWESTSTETQPSDLVARAMLAAGVKVSTSDEPTSLFLAPPLIATDAELERIASTLDDALAHSDAALSDAAPTEAAAR